MTFPIRPQRRFPVCCPVTYRAERSEGHGIIWNLSAKGWRLSGDVPLRLGQTCTMAVRLPNRKSLVMVAAIVRWARDWDQEYGLETVMVSKQTHSQLEDVLTQLEQGSSNPLTYAAGGLTLSDPTERPR
ncbi:MAG TPA: PilZ domain-containing protein [Nitrospiraceae bacterium]|nr:PilZ domain-containing protein [Nitrospiraceae bacterium]